MNSKKLIVIGGGPAGYTATLYAARAGLAPLCIEGWEAGGQLLKTTEVENFPGFPEGIVGPDLVDRIRQQAERFGAEFLMRDVDAVDLGDSPFTVTASGDEYQADAVILATGASPRTLGLPAEEALSARGVAYCSTCDGALFTGRRVAVIGGGDSALEEATSLTKWASEVVLVHRRDEFRASKIMQEYARANEKVTFATPYTVEDILDVDAGRVTGLRLRHVETGVTVTEPVDGVFVAIGHIPNTGLVRDQLLCDDQGYVLVTPGSTRTSVDGVFAAGDVVDKHYRQAITSAASGCMAALDAERWLAHQAHSRAAEGGIWGVDAASAQRELAAIAARVRAA